MLAALLLPALAFPLAAQSLSDAPAQIVDGARCAATIGAGGNLRLQSGRTLQGKCEGAGSAPTLTEGGKVIEFAIKSDRPTPKDRTELAFTERGSRFQYGRQYLVSFDISIPSGTDVTNEFFYVAQFWQSPAKPPIAGLRIQRGQAGKGTVIARGDGATPGGTSVAQVDFPADVWVSVALRIVVAPGDGSCLAATIGRGTETEWCGSIGYAADEAALPWYRFKFGIYKGSEPGKQFRVRFRNMRIVG